MPAPIARFLAPALLLVGSLTPTHGAPDPLRVLRALPDGAGSPNAQIRVTFDRPVAGSLDYSVDPKTVLRISPAAPGRLEWRDPVTITFTPNVPLRSATIYTVVVDTTFHAMDGAKLERPYTFAFRISGPRLLAGTPVDSLNTRDDVLPNQKFDLVWSMPVDPARVAATSYVELSPACVAPTGRVVRLRASGVRPIGDRDDWSLREAGGRGRDRTADSLRRVVSLTPASPLPLNCAAELVAPVELDSTLSAGLARWGFRTYGPLALVAGQCGYSTYNMPANCPTGPVALRFSNSVRGSALRKAVKLIPDVPFTMSDTTRESSIWQFDAELKPRTRYAIVIDTSLRDVFGQKLTGNPAVGIATTGYEPDVSYSSGRLLVERKGFGTLPVSSVNVDTLIVTVAPVPDSLEGDFLGASNWRWAPLWKRIASSATVTRVPVRHALDAPIISGVRIPLPAGGRRGLVAVRIDRPRPPDQRGEPEIALVQVTDLAVHARLAPASGVVWVTRVSDGTVVPGATVTVHDVDGRVLATAPTDPRGIATFPRLVRKSTTTTDDDEGDEEGWSGGNSDGYVEASLGDDRALVGVSEYDPDLSPWQFGVSGAWGPGRLPLAAAVFTERGIYRPGEPLYAKAILRRGPLGALVAPAARDSLRWVFYDREGARMRDTVTRLTTFGTATYTATIPGDAKLGGYTVGVEYNWNGKWQEIDRAWYRIAEYRPPEFLVDVVAPKGTLLAGDSLRASIEARYLFGAPMARATVEWRATSSPWAWWGLDIPGLESGEWYFGETGWWWEDDDGDLRDGAVIASGTDTLDASGRRTVSVGLPPSPKGRASTVTVTASITDVNRQSVAGSASVVVHPAEFYIAARPLGESYFWRAGAAQSVAVQAVRPDGQRVPGVAVRGSVVRREWHQVHRVRDGAAETVGEWVSDTVARCSLKTAAEPVRCDFTPAEGGMYVVGFEAKDAKGRQVRTSFGRWASGKDWVPWEDESRFRMDLIADKSRYSVGDTATVMVASQFTPAEAWITVEREGLIEQRKMTLTSGSTLLKFPITEAFAPNAFVSVVVTRGRSAPPGQLDDPGRPTMRVGYVELRVTPETKRLAVTVQPMAAEYRPGDSARVKLHVADARGTGRRAEVTLWAVDEGVLSLTGYKTPDPLDLLYQPRGLGMRLASNLVAVAPQIPEGEKGRRNPGGGGGADAADVLRSRFKTTAFFLGSVVTDASGDAIATAKLPDNLTTFRVMAVAVTQADRFGSGEAKMLVTRPLVARPALPRFLRPGDDFTAGTVVNRRSGAAGEVTVQAASTGVELRGDAEQRASLEQGRGTEVRFPFRASIANAGDLGDTAVFRFTATGAGDVDAVQTKLPYRPDYHPRAYTTSGVLRDTATAELVLPAGTDAARSRIEISFGGSVMALVQGAYHRMRVYPWYCTEQVTSAGRPILSLYSAAQASGAPNLAPSTARRDLELAVRMLSDRQREDGGIGYWDSEHWTTPWLSAYAADFLIDAREAGIAVNDSVLARLAEYLKRSLKTDVPSESVMRSWYAYRGSLLAERVATVDLLSRLKKPDVAAENQLVAQAAQLRWEDRARLAEVIARRGAMRTAAELLSSEWSQVQIEGRRAVLPEAARDTVFYFESVVRPAARLLQATLAVNPTHPLVGPLVENVVQQGRATRWWNTQDWASAVEALVAFERKQRASPPGVVRVRSGNRVLFATDGRSMTADSTMALTGLLSDRADGASAVRLTIDRPGATAGAPPVYFYATVREVPQRRPVRPDDHGIQVERWYERFDSRAPITSIAEGELVRVRLRITIPADREFVVIDDALPAGLEAVDLSLRTTAPLPGPGANQVVARSFEDREEEENVRWGFGSWDSGWWSPFDHRELRDDRVVYFATRLWRGSYTASYIARATTPGVFVRPPTHAEEMYNPAIFGRSDGGVFTVTKKPK
ncbi:MAG TPA: alpha-2-macroglobulin family protein [Gemmatimonadaceae bacterium]|nr:alpha-2-macroglobulin family protein [Gemmatimonadaceae bacterium]